MNIEKQSENRNRVIEDYPVPVLLRLCQSKVQKIRKWKERYYEKQKTNSENIIADENKASDDNRRAGSINGSTTVIRKRCHA